VTDDKWTYDEWAYYKVSEPVIRQSERQERRENRKLFLLAVTALLGPWAFGLWVMPLLRG
jgi:hypothetical protein